jgi:3-oxoadipate enol-lactonase
MVAEHAAHLLGGRAWALALCGGAAAWPEAAGAVFAERARLARAGRMDDVAEAVSAAGLSERCRREDPRLLGLMREAIASCDGESYARGAEATAAAAMRDPSALALPLLAFCGSEDPVTPPAAAEAIAAAAPQGRTEVVQGAAHWCMLEDPGTTSDVLFGFLEAVAPPSG